jgi:hypothetical protein
MAECLCWHYALIQMTMCSDESLGHLRWALFVFTPMKTTNWDTVCQLFWCVDKFMIILFLSSVFYSRCQIGYELY